METHLAIAVALAEGRFAGEAVYSLHCNIKLNKRNVRELTVWLETEW